jgi:hypothetical protein
MGRFIRGQILVRTIDFGFVLEMRQQSCGVIRHATPLDTRLARDVTNTKSRSSSMVHVFPEQTFQRCEDIRATRAYFHVRSEAKQKNERSE